ncbi:HAD family hydrolase [Enemella sp. A6]|uniref:HAD family hydrolase n=1 Tax=Enemella sp. A6 TaxID=3440152 RepID=UPI003EBBFC0E
MTHPAAVLFDNDGTLADTEPMWVEVEREVCREIGGEYTPEVRDATLGNSMEGTAEILIDAAGRTDLEVAEVSELLTVRAVERLESGGFEFMPGAVELLAALDEAGIPLALVSAADTRVLAAVTSRLPKPYFSVIIGNDSVTRGKPDPEGYLMAAAELGVNPADCLVIEDTAKGAQAGNASGARVIVVPNAEGIVVPEAPRRSFVDTLAGLGVADLAAMMESADA